MRTDAAREHRVAVDMQMLRRDGGSNIGPRCNHEIDCLCGGDMFENNPQFREIAHHLVQGTLDEHRLPVENVDIMVGHLAMDQQGHIDCLHPLKNAIDVGDIGDTMGAIGGGVGGI